MSFLDVYIGDLNDPSFRWDGGDWNGNVPTRLSPFFPGGDRIRRVMLERIDSKANEGKLLAITAASEADRVLAAMQSHPLGREAAIIGEVTDDHPGFVMMKTRVGGKRVVDMLSGEQLPRIC
jgi:hypothetical protein